MNSKENPWRYFVNSICDAIKDYAVTMPYQSSTMDDCFAEIKQPQLPFKTFIEGANCIGDRDIDGSSRFNTEY